MNRLASPLLLCLLAGCSTHPLVDLCDLVQPGKLYPNQVQPYGGVGIPQGPIVPGAPMISVGPPAPLVSIGPGVIPPPQPLPGNQPPPPFPVGDVPPPFPPPPPAPPR